MKKKVIREVVMAENKLPICSCCGKEITKVEGTGEDKILTLGGKKFDVGALYNGKYCSICHRIFCLNCIVDVVITKHKPTAENQCQKCGGDMSILTSKTLDYIKYTYQFPDFIK
jgi:hypothetical protein